MVEDSSIPDNDAPSKDFSVGEVVVGKYKVLRVLGRGGYGTVYLVEITSGMVGQKLALKVLSREIDGDGGASKEIHDRVQRRFMNEIRVAMRLVNKYIIQIRDCGATAEGLLYYTMDYSPGVTLSRVIKETGPLGIARSSLIVLRVLRGLFAAHDQGVIHRDLKPANIMVESGGNKETVKILDFGIATAVQDQPAQPKTFIGSPYYMPPEQFVGEGFGEWSDLYSVGVVLYECLTGKRPYTGKSAREVYEAIMRGPAESPRKINSELNQCLGIVRVVTKALERSPENRYRDARDFFSDLNSAFDDWKTKQGVGASGARTTPKIDGVTQRRRASRARLRRSPVGLLVWGSIILLLLFAGLFFYTYDGPTNDRSSPELPLEEPAKTGSNKEDIFKKTARAPRPKVAQKKRLSSKDIRRHAEVAFETAQDLWATGRRTRSDLVAIRTKCDEIRRIDAEFSDCYLLRGKAELELRLWDSAYESFQTALLLQPENPDPGLISSIYRNLARASAAGVEDPAETLFYLRKALDVDGENPEVFIEILERLDEKEDATEIKTLLQTARQNGVSHSKIDELYHKIFVLIPEQKAEARMRLSAEIDEFFAAGDFESVVEKGLELFAEHPDTDLGLRIAFAHRERWEFDKGLDMLYSVIRSVTNSKSEKTKDLEWLASVGLDYARIYLAAFEAGYKSSNQTVRSALTNLKAARDLLTDNRSSNDLLKAHVLSYAARCYLHMGENKKLFKRLDQAKAKGVKNAYLTFHQGETLYLLAQKLIDRRKKERFYGQAVARLSQARRQVDRKAEVRVARRILYTLGLSYLGLGERSDLNTAVSSFRKARRLGFETPKLYSSWGVALVKLDKLREAAKMFRESYNLKPSVKTCYDAAYYFHKGAVRSSAEEILLQGLGTFPQSGKLKELLEIVRNGKK